ncbi:hypothetical protein HF086_008516 [Spodoptera exigua]|uniref:Uncharacterized protein n=1 Tax=Spodoptera exigua TaxID=7107 RepID=A0A922SCW9_SPOEX|nr:hypothetical protein HF086_008516 [Spodoptera exigua]
MFWPISGRNLARKTTQSCLKCKRYQVTPADEMATSKGRDSGRHPGHREGRSLTCSGVAPWTKSLLSFSLAYLLCKAAAAHEAGGALEDGAEPAEREQRVRSMSLVSDAAARGVSAASGVRRVTQSVMCVKRKVIFRECASIKINSQGVKSQCRNRK